MLTRKELYNIPGWHTRRHLVVIESDDWGSIRTPSKAVYNEFLRRWPNAGFTNFNHPTQ